MLTILQERLLEAIGKIPEAEFLYLHNWHQESRTLQGNRRQPAFEMALDDAYLLIVTALGNLLPSGMGRPGILYLIHARVGRVYNIFVINRCTPNNSGFTNENLFLSAMILVNRPLLLFKNNNRFLTLNMLSL